MPSSSPNNCYPLWTCITIPPSSSVLLNETSPSVTLPAKTLQDEHAKTTCCTTTTTGTTRSEETDKEMILDCDDTSTTASTTKYHTIYGPGELELYRHAQLVQTVKDAKLKVWYPGSWMHHSRHAYFRTTCVLVGGADAANNIAEIIEKDRRELVLFKFRSNARIISALSFMNAKDDTFECNDHCTKSDGKEEATAASRPVVVLESNGIPLRWKTSIFQSSCSEEKGYDHAILAPDMQNESMHGNYGASSSPTIILELDTSRTNECLLSNLNAPGKSFGHASNLTMTTALDNPPPCISWELHHSTTNHRNWEWKVSLDDDWIPINSLWMFQQRKVINMEQRNYGEDVNAAWHFPHQIDLCQEVSTVHPAHQIRDVGITNMDERIFDFGKELLGKVQIFITDEILVSDQSTVLLRVGETLAEAMNDEEECFEQCVDMSNCTLEHDVAHASCASDPSPISANNGGRSVQLHSFESSRQWISCHLLAFRYVRVILPNNGRLKISVLCKSHSPLLQQRGSFSCSDETSMSAVKNEIPNLDSKIWQTSAYTLQLCTYHNFIIDGIKRDRLPWMGDLAVSLMASAYTFRDEESVRSTLVVLGRCGMNNLTLQPDTGKTKTASTATSHINGIVDYSLWYFICHWLYQRYFGDLSFLHQEWRMIEQRLRYLVMCCSDKVTGMFVVNDDDCLFIDWTGNHAEKSLAVQILWWYALDCATSLAHKVADLARDSAQHGRIRAFILMLGERQSTVENSFLQMNDMQRGFSRHSHILGVVSGLYKRLDDRASEGEWYNPNFSDEKWQTIRRCRNFHDRSRTALMENVLPGVATPYMKHLEVMAFRVLGERIHALESIRSYWGGMIDADASTFFEAFKEKEELSDISKFYNRRFGRSLCHAWAAGPCALLPEILLGIRPLSDGWKEWQCDPLQGTHSSVSVSIETKYGVIDVKQDTEHLHVCIPVGSCMILMGSRYIEGRHSFSRKSLMSSQDIHVWSTKYRGWQHHSEHVIKPNVTIQGFEGIKMTDVPTVYQLPGDDLFYMSFVGFDGVGYQSFLAESTDLISWTNIRLAMGYGEEGMFDFGGVVLGAYLYASYDVNAPRVLKQVNGKFYSLYGAYAKKNTYEPDPGFQGLASSKDGLIWEREKNESILSIYGPGLVKDWEKDSIYQPWLVYHDEKYYNFYNAKKMPQWIEQIGLATSTDMYNWTRHADNPVLGVSHRDDIVPNNGFDTQFASDAKVFWDNSHWIMFYFGVGKGGAHIMVAFSRDLVHWVRDPIPLYTAGGNPSGLDKRYAHKVSLVWNPTNELWHMFYCAVGDDGRGIGLITSRSHAGKHTSEEL